MFELDDGPPPIGNLRGAPLRSPTKPGDAVRGGSAAGLAFELRRPGKEGSPGELAFHLGGERAWDVALTPESLTAGLLGLARSWAFLRVEDNYLADSSSASPSAVLSVALVGSSMGRQPSELRRGNLFWERHDVSRWAAAFADAGPLRIVREGELAVVEVGGRTMRRGYTETLAALLALGQALATDPTAEPRGVKAWSERDDVPDERLASASLGMPLGRLRKLVGDGVQLISGRREMFQGLGAVGAAARMLGQSVDDEELRGVVDRIRVTGPVRTEVLDELSKEAVTVIDAAQREIPHMQGLRLAGWLRDRLGLADEQRFDPEVLLAAWGVPVQPFVTRRRIEAVAFWGREHGPAILLNSEGKSNRGRATTNGFTGGARATLSHEICHLLADRTGSLPVADVLGGRVPSIVEVRANSFAAEMLLPQAAAGRAFQAAAGVDAAVGFLTRAYGISRTMAAWQIRKRFRSMPNVLSEKDLEKLRVYTRRLPDHKWGEDTSEGPTVGRSVGTA